MNVSAPPDDRIAIRIARQLVGEDPTPAEIQRWRDAIVAQRAELVTPRDARLWALLVRAPWLIGVVDAGLAFSEPHSAVRHRLCLMLAVLEASPAHTKRFLSREYPLIALVGLGFRMVFAAARVALGLALVGSWGIVWR